MKSLAFAVLALVTTSSVSLAQLRIALPAPWGGPLALLDPTTGDVVDSTFILNFLGQPYSLTNATHVIQTRERLWSLGNGTIERFDLAGTHVDSIPPWVSGPDACIRTGCFANERVYGVCLSGSDVHMLDLNGQYVGSFSTLPNLGFLQSIVEFEGALLISGSPRKIGRFAYDGTFLGDFHVSNAVNDFGRARQLAVTDVNTILVASDLPPYGVFEFDSSGGSVRSMLFGSGSQACAPLSNGDVLTVSVNGLVERYESATGNVTTLQNLSIGNPQLSRVHLVPPPTSYCTAGTSSGTGPFSCAALTGATGWPSATANSGFIVFAESLPSQRLCRFFYGISGRAATPWTATSTSFICAAAPHQRMGLTNSNGGSAGCDGLMWTDWLAYVAGSSSVLGEPFSPGDVVNLQAWYRDPPTPASTNLSDAIEFTLAP